jgi:hypothetical protein
MVVEDLISGVLSWGMCQVVNGCNGVRCWSLLVKLLCTVLMNTLFQLNDCEILVSTQPHASDYLCTFHIALTDVVICVVLRFIHASVVVHLYFAVNDWVCRFITIKLGCLVLV